MCPLSQVVSWAQKRFPRVAAAMTAHAKQENDEGKIAQRMHGHEVHDEE